MDNTRYPLQCYTCIMSKRLDAVVRVSWTTKVMNLLCRYEFGYEWQNQGVGNEKRFLLLFKLRLRDNLNTRVGF